VLLGFVQLEFSGRSLGRLHVGVGGMKTGPGDFIFLPSIFLPSVFLQKEAKTEGKPAERWRAEK